MILDIRIQDPGGFPDKTSVQPSSSWLSHRGDRNSGRGVAFHQVLLSGNRKVDVPDANQSNFLTLLVFVFDCFKYGIGVLASQAIPCIGVSSLCAGRRDREDEVLICLQQLLPQLLLTQDPVEVDLK